ncbi:hypothetical protein SAMN05216464_10990 [Mucilaginibacter pineti]|uniref:Uncharacterized protein n=1 Tax=Mucilaginibacter pineti TaxID=1391627 RepID=A0A1G7FJT8_9SPHI|nr:hypothetical protein SAMN05216464_10990 [Mucilaginibacter pineti]
MTKLANNFKLCRKWFKNRTGGLLKEKLKSASDRKISLSDTLFLLKLKYE